MNEQLFCSVEQRQGLRTERETTFEFLARGGRPEAVEIREWMEKWFQEFPADHRMNLKNRLQLEGFGEFMGTYFELQIFAMLRRLNCHVEIHPCFDGTESTVDFRVKHGNLKFYVEATVCGINQGILRSNANEEDAVCKIRETVTHRHSDVWLEATGELCKTLGRHRLVGPIKGLLESCTADEVRMLQGEGLWRPPRTSIVEGEWKLDVYLSPPIASDGRGQVWGPMRGGPVDGSSQLAGALFRKAENWKKKRLERDIFLLAVNVCHSDYSWGEERGAVYGRPAPIVDQDAFSEPLSRVAGVIVFGNATLGRERIAPVQLYRNANKCIPECLHFLANESSSGQLLGIG